MAQRTRFWRSPRWRDVMHPDGDLAQVEGLAAGTGLLTGDVARHRAAVPAVCPSCDGTGEVVVIDLVAHAVSRRCRLCGHRWTVEEPPAAQAH
jgi:hypothetical protein